MAGANVVERLSDEITLAILRGEMAPGSKLPSVRALSEQHGVNISTVQRVLARLEESGVVVTRARSGVVVRDPARYGGGALWPLMLRRAEEQRERAVALLRDGLAARRVLSLEVVRALSQVPYDRYGKALEASIASFGQALHQKPRQLVLIAETENEILRTVLLAAQRPAVLAIFNDIAAMLLASELILAAMYADPELHLSSWLVFREMLSAGGRDERLAFIEPLLSSRDEGIVDRYARALNAQTKGKAQPKPPKRKSP